MKIITILGSPRMKGNTAKVLSMFEDQVGQNHEVERIDIIKEQLGEKNKSLGKQVKHVQTLELERNKAGSTYTTLKKMEDNFEWYKDGVRAIMKERASRSNP